MSVETDRALLELAAKAARYQYAKHGGYIVVDGIPGNWNPLRDDGDALRLVVALKIDIEFDEWNGKEIVTASSPEDFTGWLEEEALPDPNAATRRAIVRAAAAIGKAMK